MTIYVKDKNNQVHEFPNGTSKEDMRNQLNSVVYNQDKATKSSIDKKALNDYFSPSNTFPARLVKAGLMGLGEAGQNIASTFTGGKAPRVNMEEVFNMKDPNIAEKLVEGVGQYAPLIAGGAMSLIPDIASGALYGATQSPDEKLYGAEVGGASSGAFNVLGKLLQASNPLIKTASKALLGGSIGYGAQGSEGAVEGGLGAVLFPKLAKKMGFSTNPAKDIVSKIKPSEVSARSEAAQRLGTSITPGEASARPDITGMESSIGKTGEAAAERVKIGQQRIKEQQEAIKKLHQSITSSGGLASFDARKAAQESIEQMKQAREEAAEPFYKIAHEEKVSPTLITSLSNSDKNIGNAIDEALNDPKYQVQGELLGYPENSIKVLDYAKRKLDAKIEQAKNFGDNDAVRVFTNSKNKLLDRISGFSPDYAEARKIYSEMSKPIDEVIDSQVGHIAGMKDRNLKNLSKSVFDPSQTDITVLKNIKSHIQKQNPEAWDLLVSNELSRLMTQGKKSNITGRSFFDNVLANDNRFKQFQAALDHNPQALQQLNDMKSAWEHLINIETPRTAAGQSKTSMNIARSSVQAIVDIYNNLAGAEKQIKALNYLYSDKWQKDLGKVKSLPKSQQKGMMSILLGKTIAPAYLLQGEEK